MENTGDERINRVAFTNMTEFFTHKRWTLKDGAQEAELVDLVQNEIAPHYSKLEGCLELGLLRITDSRSYLAIQHWVSREVWEATLASKFYETWFEAYQPILERWDQIMDFDVEWEAEDVLGKADDALTKVPKLESELWGQEVAYLEYLQAADLEGYLSLLHEDFMGWPNDSPAPLNKDCARQVLTQSMTANQIETMSFESKPTSLRIFDNVGIVLGEVHARVRTKAGEEIISHER